MIHPSSLMRTNSDIGSQFSAPISRRRQEVDCGWTALPCLAKKLNLEMLAKAEVFLVFYSILWFLQGAMLSYFRGTSHIWTEHYQFPNVVVDWLLCANEIFVGIFALLISYWGNKIHRMSWMGGLAIFQAFVSVMLVIPETHEPRIDNFMNRSVTDFLCTGSSENLELLDGFNVIAIALFFLFQLLSAFATVSSYTLGISYLDDNIDKDNAPTYFAIPLAMKIIGKQPGLYLSWIPALTNNLTVFTTPMWLVLSSMIFIFGAIITLFPRNLLDRALKKVVATLLNFADRNRDGNDRRFRVEESEEKHDPFFVVLLRLLKNPVLMLNIAACTVMGVAFVNLELFQHKFFQSRFFVQVGSDWSGYQDNIISKISNIIRYPFIGTSLIATGFILAKLKPKAKYLALFNVIIYSLTALCFVSFAFMSCDVTLHSEMQARLTTPYCSSDCMCPKNTPFMPVCTDQGRKTYFSPCHAGCQSLSFSNTKIYSNCTCGEHISVVTSTTATEGSCDQSNCSLLFAFAQAGIIMASSFMIGTVITNILINLRIVLPGDKAMALALESTFLGILPYIPGKLVYSSVSESLCRFYGNDRCLLNSKAFGLFFSITTIVLMGLAALLSVGVVLLIKDVQIWTSNDRPSTSSDDYYDEFENSRLRRLAPVTDLDDDLDFRLRTIDDSGSGSERNNQNRWPTRREPGDILESAL